MVVLNFLKRYLLNILIVLDIAVNALVLLGSPYETISSRAGKAQLKQQRWGCVLCRVLDWLQKGHCKTAMAAQMGTDAIIPD